MTYEINRITGLDEAILKVIQYHVGRDRAIKRPLLLETLAGIGYKVNDREMRNAINDMRKRGVLICSAACEDGGYYLPANLLEYKEFAQRELGAKIADMSQSLQAMDKAALERFGDSAQMRLI